MRHFKNGMLMNENRGTWAKFSPAQRQQGNKQVEITTLTVQNNAEKVGIPVDSCTNPSVTTSAWSTCQLHNCSTLAIFISRLIPSTELLVPDIYYTMADSLAGINPSHSLKTPSAGSTSRFSIP